MRGPSVQAATIYGGLHFALPERDTVPVPRQLPHVPAHFAGRASELETLDRIRAECGGQDPVLIVISGTAGAGKTTLASHWLSSLAGDFPDGQLYVDLRGFDPAGPVAPEEVLGQFLRALGTPPDGVPPSMAERTALWRSVSSRRRLSILLDNAITPDQVRPLLPAGPVTVVVTSRRQLSGLTLNGARALLLGALAAQDAVELLVRLVGRERVNAEAEPARQLVRLCGALPLAVSMVGARLAARPSRRLGRLVAELAEEEHLGGLTVAGDISLGTVFDHSYRALPHDARRLYRLASLHPGPEFGASAAAAAAGVPVREARRLLEVLVEASMLEEWTDDRYRYHDLLRRYARQCAEREEAPVALAAAARRIVDWYLYTATTADRTVAPYHRPRPYDVLTVPPDPLCFTGVREAVEWLDTERLNMLTAITWAVENQTWSVAWQLAWAMWTLFRHRKHFLDWLKADRLGLAAARAGGDRYAEAEMLNQLGLVYTELKRFPEADDYQRAALMIWRDLGNGRKVAETQRRRGLVRFAEGRHEDALALFEQSTVAFEDLAEPRYVAIALANRGDTMLALGRPRDARPLLERARLLFDDAADPYGLAKVKILLGQARRTSGDLAGADELLSSALAEMTGLGSTAGMVRALMALADVAEHRGDIPVLLVHLHRAAETYEQLGLRSDAAGVRARIQAIAPSPPVSGVLPAAQARPDRMGQA